MNKKQAEMIKEYEEHVLFEFMGKERIKGNDPEGFIREFDRNVEWMEDHIRGCESIIANYRKKHLS